MSHKYYSNDCENLNHLSNLVSASRPMCSGLCLLPFLVAQFLPSPRA
jgi:hypothetical protein